MAAHLIEEGDAIQVTALAVVIFGPPGSGKTSIAQTCANPYTLDFDKGLHRSFNRKGGARFDCFRDVDDPAVKAKIKAANTIVIDTIGRLLDTLSGDIMTANAKHGTAAGGLTLQGFGALKSRFAMWMNQLRLAGKDVIMVCHEKEEKDGDDRIMRMDIQGGSYTEVHKLTDMIGYLGVDRSGRKTLDFNPSDRHVGKNAAGWGVIDVPKLEEQPDFFGRLLADAKASIGKATAASTEVASGVQKWAEWLATPSGSDIDSVNGVIPDLAEETPAVKKQAWAIIEKHCKAKGWSFDKETKTFKAAA